MIIITHIDGHLGTIKEKDSSNKCVNEFLSRKKKSVGNYKEAEILDTYTEVNVTGFEKTGNMEGSINRAARVCVCVHFSV